MYTHEVRFTKHFTSGLLAGLAIQETLRVVSDADGWLWVQGVRANHRRGRINWTPEDVTVVPIEGVVR
jgi:hypothetical protein